LERNLPWAVKQAIDGRFLLSIDWENRFEQNISDLQEEFGIKPLNSFKIN
jgi:ubiquinone biosynthesis protein Coq4